jgi:chromosome segregation ATPase
MNTYEINARNEVIPYTSGRKCTDTRAWRDATELELQQQDQIQNLERELTAARAEIERLDTVGIHSCHDNCQRWTCVLRRELKAVTEQRDQWKDKYIQQNKDLGHELRDPNGTIWSECKRLQTELKAVTEQRDQWKDKYFQQWNGTIWSECKRLQTELDAVTKQRDGLR